MLREIYGKNILAPVELSQFLFDYKHSKFIECNRDYAKESVGIMGLNNKAEAMQNVKAKHGLVYIKSVLESHKKNYWLAAGTLLGWYRDCGFIPHTTDADLAVWEHEFDNNITNAFKGNKNAMLVQTLGLRREAFELRLYTSLRFTVDIFLMYKINDTYQWNGYQGHRKLYR